MHQHRLSLLKPSQAREGIMRAKKCNRDPSCLGEAHCSGFGGHIGGRHVDCRAEAARSEDYHWRAGREACSIGGFNHDTGALCAKRSRLASVGTHCSQHIAKVQTVRVTSDLYFAVSRVGCVKRLFTKGLEQARGLDGEGALDYVDYFCAQPFHLWPQEPVVAQCNLL